MANGYGEYIHINGSKYKGEFKDDVQEGHGEEEWIDGAKYVGSYKNGMKHGYGVYKWAIANTILSPAESTIENLNLLINNKITI